MPTLVGLRVTRSAAWFVAGLCVRVSAVLLAAGLSLILVPCRVGSGRARVLYHRRWWFAALLVSCRPARSDGEKTGRDAVAACPGLDEGRS